MGFYCRRALGGPTRRRTSNARRLSPRYQTVTLVISVSRALCKEEGEEEKLQHDQDN